jgi:hypothetical protein
VLLCFSAPAPAAPSPNVSKEMRAVGSPSSPLRVCSAAACVRALRSCCVLCACTGGGRQLSTGPVCVGPSWPGGLVAEERCGGSGRWALHCWRRKGGYWALGGGGEGGRRPNGHIYPPGCYLFRRDVMSRGWMRMRQYRHTMV